MRTAAILPVKRFELAKQRLGATVADELRRRLAAAMVSDVLDALAATSAIELTIVVTREQSAAELELLLASGSRGERPEVVIVPDRHGSGTNGLLLLPPDAIEPSFGPESCSRHRALAEGADARWRLERPASLLLDIDTGADLDVLRERLAAVPAGAVRTRSVLAGPEPALPAARCV